MGDFQRCIDLILTEEGGFVHHPRDPGGPTQYGISQRAYPALNVATLTLAEAKALYRRDYWDPIRGDDLPPGLALLVFDSAVNQGPRTAAVLLQEALGVAPDGLIGPITVQAARQRPPEVLDAFCALRAWRYELNRHEETFGKGWFRRLFRLHALARDWSQTP